MIDKLQIFRRRNNIYEFPSIDWDLNHEIYVSGEINLGLYDKVIFDKDNAPTLRRVIKLIQLLRNSSNPSIELTGKKKVIEITKPNYNEIEIYKLREGQKELLMKKSGYFDFGFDLMLVQIYAQLEKLNRELRNYYCNYIRPLNTNHKFDFELGDLVKTTDIESISNYREGLIYALEYHLKEKVNLYYIRIDGNIHNRKYRKEELTLNEYDR